MDDVTFWPQAGIFDCQSKIVKEPDRLPDDPAGSLRFPSRSERSNKRRGRSVATDRECEMRSRAEKGRVRQSPISVLAPRYANRHRDSSSQRNLPNILNLSPPTATRALALQKYSSRHSSVSALPPAVPAPFASRVTTVPAFCRKPSESPADAAPHATSTQPAKPRFDKRFSSRSERSHQEASSALGTTGTQNAQ